MRIVFLVLLLGIPGIARAEETRARLEKGQSVWGILKGRGCSNEEVSRLWPAVLSDSGLLPQNHREIPVGQLILLKRSCDGSLVEGANISSLQEKLSAFEAENAKLRSERDMARAEAEMIAKEAAREQNGGASETGYLVWVLAGAIVLQSVIMFIMWRRLPGSAELRFKPEIVVEHWGQKYVFDLFTDTETCTVGYKCRNCDAIVPNREQARFHMKVEHRDLGVTVKELVVTR